MIHVVRLSFAAALALGALVLPARAVATPSTEIWIPSIDLQPFLVPHLNFDAYVRTRSEPDSTRRAPLWLFGPTIGVLPWEKVQLEVGLDLIWQGVNPADQYPIYFHAKLGTPEDSMFKRSPGLVVGIYNAGVKRSVTTHDIGYSLVGRTLPGLGRFSVGYFYANRNASIFFDEHGNVANQGLLAAWDRTMKEISPRLTLLVDYQGSASWIGAASFGFQWCFTEQISMIFAYDLYTNRSRVAGTDTLVAGRDTFTVQLDINLARLVETKQIPAPPPAPQP
jgi:hypothetical protein